MKEIVLGIINGDKLFELYSKKVKLKFDKKYKLNINIDIKIPPIINLNKDLRVKMNKHVDEFQQCLFQFEDVLKNKNINLNIYYKNLKSLKINKSNFVQKCLNQVFGCCGWYFAQNNEINVDNTKTIKNTVFHELLHMSTSIYDKKTSFLFCGFEQTDYKKDKKIGIALNEGYTEFLNQKYFSPDSSSYWFETVVVEMLENVIGEEKMQKFYFNADLNGLINEFSRYIDKEQIFNFLIHMDLVNEYLRSNKLVFIRERLNESARFIYNVLVESYYNFLNLSGLEFNEEKKKYLEKFEFDFRLALCTYGVGLENNKVDFKK